MIDESVENEIIVGQNHSRKSFIAFLLSVFFAGLGQMYNGQLRKGLLFFLLSYIILFFCSAFHLLLSFNGFIVFFSLLCMFKIYTVGDAVFVAKKLKIYNRTKYNIWYFHLLFALDTVVISMIFNVQTILGVRTFVLPTSSNYPTTLVGDRIFVNLNAYEHTNINYGDLVVFNSPKQEVWTFRVVGIPRDKIEIKNQELIINGVKLKTTYEKDAIDGDYEVSQFLEELPNGFKHSIYRYKDIPDSSHLNISEITVPVDSYFLLGDNRDNAYDSSYIGPVNRVDIFAQVMYVFWSKDISRMGLDFRNSK